MNIIEFVLHPNGDITKPIITSSSGYEALDKNTIKTIEIAYKDYPRPSEPTKIRIYVTYRLY
jgi:protein TonB